MSPTTPVVPRDMAKHTRLHRGESPLVCIHPREDVLLGSENINGAYYQQTTCVVSLVTKQIGVRLSGQPQ
ncbi:hypothetical protein RvY_16838 [Ramazzottius varieornatus]|uniref:Uncharacterized protein n=1 Tax=Ramazzottius varieornatus TaxID=947166 RepID=A0A1D1VZX9_RAMVA|nr:hypothetical protein RvY_16838 [Ramazzottius varieornatus]